MNNVGLEDTGHLRPIFLMLIYASGRVRNRRPRPVPVYERLKNEGGSLQTGSLSDSRSYRRSLNLCIAVLLGLPGSATNKTFRTLINRVEIPT